MTTNPCIPQSRIHRTSYLHLHRTGTAQNNRTPDSGIHRIRPRIGPVAVVASPFRSASRSLLEHQGQTRFQGGNAPGDWCWRFHPALDLKSPTVPATPCLWNLGRPTAPCPGTQTMRFQLEVAPTTLRFLQNSTRPRKPQQDSRWPTLQVLPPTSASCPPPPTQGLHGECKGQRP